jgi:hypothetical protein
LKNKPSGRAWFPLLLCLGSLLAIWLVLLPWISNHPAALQWSAFLDSRGVNPNAKFFTDQQAGFVHSRKVMQQARENPRAFWQPGRGLRDVPTTR